MMELAIGAAARYLPLFKLRICSLITVSALAGLLLSPGAFPPGRAAFLALATLAAAAAASALNHYFDRDIDRVMQRTRSRPLEQGCSPRVALVSAAALLALSTGVSLAKLGFAPAVHLMLGAFVYAVVYTVWLKRRSPANIIVGGLAGSFAVLAGGASNGTGLDSLPVMLAAVMFLWTPPHFWSFAIAHREDYDRARVPMLPSVVGEKKAAIVILVNTLFLVAASIAPVIAGRLGPAYFGTAIFAGVFFLYTSVRLVKDASKRNALMNFRASMAYIGLLFAGIALDVVLL